MAEEENNWKDLEKTYEEMFAFRYTDDDADYKNTVASPIPECPCVEGYFTRSRRNFNRGGGPRQWGGRGHRDHNRRDDGHHGGYNRHGGGEHQQDHRGRGGYGRGGGGYNRDSGGYGRGGGGYNRDGGSGYGRDRYRPY